MTADEAREYIEGCENAEGPAAYIVVCVSREDLVNHMNSDDFDGIERRGAVGPVLDAVATRMLDRYEDSFGERMEDALMELEDEEALP